MSKKRVTLYRAIENSDCMFTEHGYADLEITEVIYGNDGQVTEIVDYNGRPHAVEGGWAQYIVLDDQDANPPAKTDDRSYEERRRAAGRGSAWN